MKDEYIEFLKHAYENNLCEEYKNEIRKCHDDELELVRLAMRQQSIPYVATKMHEGLLSKKYVAKRFGRFLNGFILHDCDDVKGYTYTWYMDYRYDNDIETGVDVMHVSHTDDADVVIAETKCPSIYVSNGSTVHLICEGYNSVKVYLFDESSVVIEDTDETSTVTIYKYSDECSTEMGKYCLGKVNEFRKELRL